MTRSHSPDSTSGGLFTGSERIPLRGVAIDVRARGVAAEVTVSQRYENRETKPVEAVYTFPLDESCAVRGFEAEIGGKRIVGRVEEREKAFEKYDDAMAEGHGAFLVDQDRTDIFTASVGNLLPGQEAVIRLTYVTELEQAADAIRLAIPTTVSPRYIPRHMAANADPAELEHLTPPTVLGGVPYGLRLTVEIEANDTVREVCCPSHPARVSVSGETARVELAGEDVQLDRDFVLDVRLEHPHQPSAFVATEEDGTRVVMLNFFPDLSGYERRSSEFLFLIDRSGSMGGENIVQARRALELCLRSLEEGDRFNVVGFGSTFETMFPEPVAYSQKSLDLATKRVSQIDADLGGTEILAPLAHILKNKASDGPPRLVVLLTDGQVGNEDECIRLAAKHARSTRIFTFGIGHGSSRHLVRGLARASSGRAEFIHPSERIEPVVLRQFDRMTMPGLQNPRVDWNAIDTDLVAPTPLPPLFDGDRLTVYARVRGGIASEASLAADGPDGELRFPVAIDLERGVPDPGICALMARRAIEDLEEGREVLPRGSAQRGAAWRRGKRTAARIRELAMRYRLMSSQTSFVAIEERTAEEKVDAAAELRRIPIALTKGWGGVDVRVMRGAVQGATFRTNDGIVQSCLMDTQGFAESCAPAEPPRAQKRKSFRPEIRCERDWTRAKPEGEADDLLELVRSQQASGAFAVTKVLVRVSGFSRHELKAFATTLDAKRGEGVKIFATLIALWTFECRFADRRDEWTPIARKARRWLAGRELVAPNEADSLPAWAQELVKYGIDRASRKDV